MSRVNNIDILKAICAFLVVCIHAPFSGSVGNYFMALDRIAVPIFVTILDRFARIGGFYNVYKLVAPVVIYIVSLLFLMAVCLIKK